MSKNINKKSSLRTASFIAASGTLFRKGAGGKAGAAEMFHPIQKYWFVSMGFTNETLTTNDYFRKI